MNPAHSTSQKEFRMGWVKFAIAALMVSNFCILFLCAPAAGRADKPVKIRIGHFPNITHAQALVMHSRHSLEEALASEAIVEWKVFNAGPSAVEAIFAGNLDLAYTGPSPAINAYIKSNGEAVRIVAGAASGGAALVVRGDLTIRSAEDLKNKKIASPQLGNTQDVALRAWLAGSGLKLKEVGGDVQVLPLANADQQTLFLKKEIDASWAVEPWVSFLMQKTGAKVFLEEADLWAEGKYSTALVLVRKRFLDEHQELVKKFLTVHFETTQWILLNPEEAKGLIQARIQRLSGKPMPTEVLDPAFARIQFTTDPLVSSVLEQALAAHRAGFLKKEPELSQLFALDILEEVLKERNIEPEWLLPVATQEQK